MSRLGGGIGTRGPGEQKLEVDRRRIEPVSASLCNVGDLVERRARGASLPPEPGALGWFRSRFDRPSQPRFAGRIGKSWRAR